MVGSTQTPKASTPKNPPSLKKSTSGSQPSSQQSIASFFQKKTIEGQAAKDSVPTRLPIVPKPTNDVLKKPKLPRGSSSSLTPAPSSDAVEEEDVEPGFVANTAKVNGTSSLPSPVTPASGAVAEITKLAANGFSKFDSPSRKVWRFFFA